MARRSRRREPERVASQAMLPLVARRRGRARGRVCSKSRATALVRAKCALGAAMALERRHRASRPRRRSIARDSDDDEMRDASGVRAVAAAEERERARADRIGEGTRNASGARKAAIFWLGQSGDPRAVNVYAELLGLRVDLDQQQERVVERVRPRGDAEPAEQVEAAEREAAQHAEGERLELERIAVRADVVERREDERADDGGENPRAARAPSRTARARQPRGPSRAGRERTAPRTARRRATASGAWSSPCCSSGVMLSACREPSSLAVVEPDDDPESRRERGRLGEHPGEHDRLAAGRLLCRKSRMTSPTPSSTTAAMKIGGPYAPGDRAERRAQNHVGAVAQLVLAGVGEQRRQPLVRGEQRQREEHAVAWRAAHREVRRAARQRGREDTGITSYYGTRHSEVRSRARSHGWHGVAEPGTTR